MYHLTPALHSPRSSPWLAGPLLALGRNCRRGLIPRTAGCPRVDGRGGETPLSTNAATGHTMKAKVFQRSIVALRPRYAQRGQGKEEN